MIVRMSVRSLLTHPVRSGVLAAGFGVGVAVMAILLGVAEVVLQQAQSPALVGGGDVVIRLSDQVPARLVLSGTLQSAHLRPRIAVAAPVHRESLFLLEDGRRVRVDAQGGIPSLERALGDREIADASGPSSPATSPAQQSAPDDGSGQQSIWADTAEDIAWTQDTPDRILRHIDRFHEIPADTEWSRSWAEWLYFNGRAGNSRFYLTFLVGPRLPNGKRPGSVRLQLERDGQMETYGASAELTDEEVMRAPDLTIATSSVRLVGMTYHLHLDLRGGAVEADGVARRGHIQRLIGDLTLEASPGRLVPPVQVAGARGWRTGYVVPVMSGALGGSLVIASDEGRVATDTNARVSFDGGTGYHDHNWGFWQGVSWQWGQMHQGELSLIYGRVFPPRDAADPDRMPGLVGVLGPDGPLGYATNVQIAEEDDGQGRPKTITIRARGTALDVDIRFDVSSTTRTRLSQGPLASGLDFFQMRGQYTVKGRAGERRLDFTAPGAAETFRGE